MKEPTLLEQLAMIARTVASTVVWVAAIVFKLVRGKFSGEPEKPTHF